MGEKWVGGRLARDQKRGEDAKNGLEAGQQGIEEDRKIGRQESGRKMGWRQVIKSKEDKKRLKIGQK